MGAMSRRKGATGEREFASLANEAGFPDAKRTAPMQAGGYADEFGDVSGIPLHYVECKRYARVPVNRFAREVLVERPGFVSLLAWRDNGQPWRVTLDARDYLAIVRELTALREENARLRSATCPAPVQHEERRCKYGAAVCTHAQCSEAA